MALLLSVSVFWLTSVSYQFPSENDLGKTGLAEVELSTVSNATTPFGSTWIYKTNLISFVVNDKTIAKNIPIRITLAVDKTPFRPVASQKYHIQGSLKKNPNGTYGFTSIKNFVWQPLGASWNLAEWRYQAKTALQQHIYESIKNHHVASFLAGIATGEFDDMHLANELGRFGLQHLMAISGLHFSILASLLCLGLCLAFSNRITMLLVILLLSGYFIFLGPSPSVMRAWITLTIALCGIFNRKSQHCH